MDIEFNISDFMKGSDQVEKAILEAGRVGVKRSVADLKRIAVNIAPIDTRALRDSASLRTWITSNKAIGEVSFSASQESPKYGRFNYALWTHEATYNLGEKSRAAGGTDGYAVGNKYLERPLLGESGKYVRWIGEEIKKAIGGAKG